MFYSIHIVEQRSTHYYIIRFESVVILRTAQCTMYTAIKRIQTLELITLIYAQVYTNYVKFNQKPKPDHPYEKWATWTHHEIIMLFSCLREWVLLFFSFTGFAFNFRM